MNSLDNVKSASDVSSTSLLNFLNLSKPQIVFDSTSDYPTVYSDTMNQSLPSVNGAYYLTYNFTIKNDTDPTPATTTYNCELFWISIPTANIPPTRCCLISPLHWMGRRYLPR